MFEVTFTRTDRPMLYGQSDHGRKVHATKDESYPLPLYNNVWALDRSTLGAPFADVPRRLRCTW